MGERLGGVLHLLRIERELHDRVQHHPVYFLKGTLGCGIEGMEGGDAPVRAVRRRELFRVAAADIFGLIDVEAVGSALSDVARATLEGGLVAAAAAIRAERRGEHHDLRHTRQDR